MRNDDNRKTYTLSTDQAMELYDLIEPAFLPGAPSQLSVDPIFRERRNSWWRGCGMAMGFDCETVRDLEWKLAHDPLSILCVVGASFTATKLPEYLWDAGLVSLETYGENSSFRKPRLRSHTPTSKTPDGLDSVNIDLTKEAEMPQICDPSPVGRYLGDLVGIARVETANGSTVLPRAKQQTPRIDLSDVLCGDLVEHARSIVGPIADLRAVLGDGFEADAGLSDADVIHAAAGAIDDLFSERDQLREHLAERPVLLDPQWFDAAVLLERVVRIIDKPEHTLELVWVSSEIKAFLADPASTKLTHDGLREARGDAAMAMSVGWRKAIEAMCDCIDGSVGNLDAKHDGSLIRGMELVSEMIGDLTPPEDIDGTLQPYRRHPNDRVTSDQLRHWPPAKPCPITKRQLEDRINVKLRVNQLYPSRVSTEWLMALVDDIAPGWDWTYAVDHQTGLWRVTLTEFQSKEPI